MNWFKCDKCKNIKWEAQKKSRTCEDCDIPMIPYRGGLYDEIHNIADNVGIMRTKVDTEIAQEMKKAQIHLIKASHISREKEAKRKPD